MTSSHRWWTWGRWTSSGSTGSRGPSSGLSPFSPSLKLNRLVENLIITFIFKLWPSKISFIWTNQRIWTRAKCLLFCLGWAGWCHGEVLGHAHVHHQCPSEDGHEGSGTATCTGASAWEGWLLLFRYAKMFSKQGFMQEMLSTFRLKNLKFCEEVHTSSHQMIFKHNARNVTMTMKCELEIKWKTFLFSSQVAIQNLLYCY